MNKTKIEWCDETWNPVVGCSHISAGCENCYAERMAARLARMPQSQKKYGHVIRNGRWSGDVRIDGPTLLRIPHRPGRSVFVNSMSDTFHGLICDSTLWALFAQMRSYPETTYMVLTKRASGMSQRYGCDFPKNVWIGVTVENQAVTERIYELDKCSARVRWLSMEPLLGPVTIPMLNHLQWVVVGCETGPGRRPCQLKWVQEILEQCDAARVPTFVKKLDIGGKPNDNPADWPEWARRREIPK